MINIIARMFLKSFSGVNGKKTIIGIIVTVIAVIAERYGVQAVGVDNPFVIVVLQIFEALGLGLTGVGVGHRMGKVKAVDMKGKKWDPFND